MLSTDMPGSRGNGKCNILIVMGDGRYGSFLHRYLCEKHSYDFDQIVALVDAQFVESSDPHMPTTLEDNCKVEYIDFSQIRGNANELNRIIGEYNINWLCVVPFGKTFHGGEIVQATLEAFKKNRGKNVLLFSSVGSETEKVPLLELRECEDKVRTQFPTKNCIFRTHVLCEDLDFFAHDVRKDKTWRLPSGGGMFAPVDMREDVTLAAAVVMRDPDIGERFRDQIYTLTGPDQLNGITLAEMTKTAFDEGDVKFAPISVDEAQKMMDSERLKDRQKHQKTKTARGGGGLGARIVSPLRIVSELVGHTKLVFSKGAATAAETGAAEMPEYDTYMRYMSDFERSMVLNRFELSREDRLGQVTDHVKAVTGRDPLSVIAYLHRHEKSFKGSH